MSTTRPDPDRVPTHEDLLEAALRRLLAREPHLLTETSEQDHLPVVRDACGEPVEVVDVATLHDAGLLTADPGVILTLSDGTRLGLTITRQRT